MIIIEDLMARLAVRRQVFCSEADFQHELAYEVRKNDPKLDIRLEWPLKAPARGAIDLVVIGATRFALELKYLCKSFSMEIDGEEITLKQHGAHDQRRYDVCKDVTRMEAYAEETGHGAGVLVLTTTQVTGRSALARALLMQRSIFHICASLPGCLHGTSWRSQAQRKTAKRL